jgi:hypothetical protein
LLMRNTVLSSRQPQRYRAQGTNAGHYDPLIFKARRMRLAGAQMAQISNQIHIHLLSSFPHNFILHMYFVACCKVKCNTGSLKSTCRELQIASRTVI